MDFPVAPSISVISDPPGKSPVTILCSAPLGHVATRYQFLRQGNVIVSQPGARLQLHQSDLDATSTYTCSYEISVSGRMIQSLPSAPLSIHLTGVPLPPPAPQIILDPPKHIYFQGEHVKLTCLVPGSEQVRGYRFYHQRREQISELDEGPWLERIAMTGNAGAYSCAYWITRSGQAILSGKSDSVFITVSAPPLVPKLSLHPKLPVYLPVEKVTLNCSAPHGEEVVGFRFHQHRGDQTPEELPTASGGPWMDLTAQMGNDGSYTCQYWRWEAGQEIVSENSNSITVPVSDHPSQPVLSVDPPSGAVSEGLPLLITCMAPEDASKRRFHFYKDGADLIPGDVGSEISTMEPDTGSINVSVLSIPWAGPESTGEFTCGYEKNIRGRWIPSPRSWAVNVTVTAKASPGSIQVWPLWIYLVAGGIGAAALLPLLLLLICLCRRRKGGITAETHPLYVNRPSSTGTVLQQRIHDGQVQPVTHNHPAPPNDPGGKPRVGRNPQERGKREEDADARVECNSLVSNPVYSMLTPSSAGAQQRGGKYISEAVVYSEIPY
ncbi:basement membrane-specific heparan sulfate proteoglycan core protein-like [Mauremys reevesii]|uniref:basement membrane-specific heparan sulfate proteoglycan core protein-like n=1 Tax=Mauremys reevesii TaxID=260615 RepID=UPI00193F6C23|nr:basement membrane-specific heparan sulfate proteoglycan core protein-like [Mauremys reevesii]